MTELQPDHDPAGDSPAAAAGSPEDDPAYTDAAESGQRSGKGNGFLHWLLFGTR